MGAPSCARPSLVIEEVDHGIVVNRTVSFVPSGLTACSHGGQSVRTHGRLGAGLARGCASMLALLAGCSTTEGPAPEPLPAFSHPAGSPAAIKGHVSALAHDSMAGRAPGTDGGRMAETYIERAFALMGLEPVLDGGYRQAVPLVGSRVRPETVVATIVGADGTDAVGLDPAHVLVRSGGSGDVITLDAPLVFVGHGVSYPSAPWDDLGDIDLEGAVAVVLPGLPGPMMEQAGGEVEFLGSWVAKAVEVSRRGAVGMVMLQGADASQDFERERELTRGFETLFPTWSGWPLVDLDVTLSPSATATLLGIFGLDWASTTGRVTPGTPVRGPSLRLRYEQSHVDRTAANVIGVLPGQSDETVVISAHSDGYGIGPPDSAGDSIYNAATDNAAGTAGLIELARVLAARSAPPQRTLVFLATTAEEQGKLGAWYFLDHLPRAARSPVVNVNVDGLGFLPPSDGIAVFPTEGSDAVAWITPVAESMGMSYQRQPWHSGMNFAFDHAEFLSRGIPAFTVWQSGSPRPGYEGRQGQGGSTHSPEDEFDPDWVDEGIGQHLQLYEALLEELADGRTPPAVDPSGPFVEARRVLEGR